MTLPAQEILETFDQLPEQEKVEVASEIIRRSLHLDIPPMTEASLVEIAEARFLSLDREEGP